jgi:glycosyltransferase involved in cell wall biosynthesis
MSHSVDTVAFSPTFRDRLGGPFTIGYVGRLTAEKNVRWLVGLERALLIRGHKNFRIIVVGDGAEKRWLRENMYRADFTGILTGKELSRTYRYFHVARGKNSLHTCGAKEAKLVIQAKASRDFEF